MLDFVFDMDLDSFLKSEFESVLDFVFDVDLDLFLESEFESVLDFVFDSVIVHRFGKVCLNRQLYNYSVPLF